LLEKGESQYEQKGTKMLETGAPSRSGPLHRRESQKGAGREVTKGEPKKLGLKKTQEGRLLTGDHTDWSNSRGGKKNVKPIKSTVHSE